MAQLTEFPPAFMPRLCDALKMQWPPGAGVTRTRKMVGATGIEPVTPAMSTPRKKRKTSGLG